jgi:hypothetical protein
LPSLHIIIIIMYQTPLLDADSTPDTTTEATTKDTTEATTSDTTVGPTTEAAVEDECAEAAMISVAHPSGSFVNDMDMAFYEVILAWQGQKPYPFFDEMEGFFSTDDLTDEAVITVNDTKYTCIAKIAEEDQVVDGKTTGNKLQCFTVTMPQFRDPKIPEALRAPIVDLATLKAYMPRTEHAVSDFFKRQPFTSTCSLVAQPVVGGSAAPPEAVALVCAPTDTSILVRFVLKYTPVM